MKKKLLIIGIIAVMAMNASAQIDNLDVFGPDWIRTPARNAATDAADIVVLNPAGLTNLKDGFHINVGNLSLFRSPSHSYILGGVTKTYEQADGDPFLPNIYLAYHKKNWAVFSGVYVIGGGATLNYSSGSITTDLIGAGALYYASLDSADYTTITNPSFKASSYYLAIPLGFNYKFSKYFSAAAGLNIISAANKAELALTMSGSAMGLPDQPLAVDAEYSASGTNFVFAVNASTDSNFIFSLRYMTKADLEFETKTNTDDLGLTNDTVKSHRDLPAQLAVGFSFDVCPKVRMMLDADFFFQQDADWDSVLHNGVLGSNSKLAGNAAMYSIAGDWTISEKVKIGLGMSYTFFYWNVQSTYYNRNLGAFETVPADNITINTGVRYKLNDKIDLTLAYMNAMYAKDKQINSNDFATMITVNNSANVIGVGANFVF